MTAGTPSHLVPRLRFPGFHKKPGWARMTLSSALVDHGLRSDGKSEVHSVSRAKGVVPQVEHLGRSFAASDTRKYRLVRPFDVVYTRSPLSLFKLGIVKQHKGAHNAIVSPLYGVFAPRNRHLGLIIEAFFASPSRAIQYLDPLAQKGAKNTIQLSNDRFLSGSIFLPEEEDEQLRVAECLGSLDELVAEEERNLEAMRQHRQGLLQRLFPHSGEAVPRLRFPEFENAPKWDEVRLEDLADFKSGGTPSKSNPAYWTGPIPWVSAKDMKRLFLDDAKDHISTAAVEGGAKTVPAGTALMLTRGMTLLKDVPISVLRREMSFNQDVKALLPKGEVSGLFIALLLLGNKHRLLRMVDVAGHGTGKLNTDELKALQLLCPQLPEQERIADCFSSLDTVIAQQCRRLVALSRHKQGLLQQFFAWLDCR